MSTSQQSNPKPPIQKVIPSSPIDLQKIQQMEKQIANLKKQVNIIITSYNLQQLRNKQIHFQSEKIKFNSQIELYQLRAEGAIQRQEDLKRAHQTMMKALNRDTDTQQTARQLKIQSQMHQNQIKELSENHKKVVDSYERQLAELRKQNLQFDSQLKKVNGQKDFTLNEIKKQFSELEIQKKSVDQQLKTFNADKKKQIQYLEAQYKNKIQAQINLIQRLKLQHAKETEKLKIESEQAVKDIKYIYQQEKMVLDGRMEKQNNTIKILQMRRESATNHNISDLQNSHIAEIQDINQQLEAFKQHSMEELLIVKDEKQVLEQQNQELQIQIERLNDQLNEAAKQQENYSNQMKSKLDQAKSNIEQGTNEEVKKLCNEIERLRKSEKRLNQVVNQKQKNLQEYKNNNQSRLEQEKQKISEAQHVLNEAKGEFNQNKEQILESMCNKDEQISSLKKQLGNMQKELSRLEHIIVKQKHNQSRKKIILQIFQQLAALQMPLQQDPKCNYDSESNKPSSKPPTSHQSIQVPPLDTSYAKQQQQNGFFHFPQQQQPNTSSQNSGRSLTRCFSQQSMHQPQPNNAACTNNSNQVNHSCFVCGSEQDKNQNRSRIRGSSVGLINRTSNQQQSPPPRSITSMGQRHSPFQQQQHISPLQFDTQTGGSANNPWIKVTENEYKLLKTCKMMVDTASSMQCSACGSLFSTDQFLEHISYSSCFLENYNTINPNNSNSFLACNIAASTPSAASSIAPLNTSQNFVSNANSNPRMMMNRTQSQGLLRVSGINNNNCSMNGSNIGGNNMLMTPFDTQTTSISPILFTPQSQQQRQQHPLQMMHSQHPSTSQMNISGIANGGGICIGATEDDDISQITASNAQNIEPLQHQGLYQHTENNIRQTSPRDILQSPHPSLPIRASHNIIGTNGNLFSTQRSQPLSARSQASIISQPQQLHLPQASQLHSQSQMLDVSLFYDDKKKLQEELRNVKLQLKQKSNKISSVKNESERQKLQNDKLLFELNKTKQEQQQKNYQNETEKQRSKQQLDFLLGKLLKTKENLASQSESKQNMQLKYMQCQKEAKFKNKSPTNSRVLNQYINPEDMSFHSHASSSVGPYYFEDLQQQQQQFNGNNRYSKGSNKQLMKKSKKADKINYTEQYINNNSFQQQHNYHDQDHKVSNFHNDYSNVYDGQYSLLPVQRNQQSHLGANLSNMYPQSVKGRKNSPNNVTKSLCTFVQNSPLKSGNGSRLMTTMMMNEEMQASQMRMYQPNTSSNRQTPSSPRMMMRKVNNSANRKGNNNVTGRSFQADMSCTTIGSPKHGKSQQQQHYNGSSNRRPASQRKINMVQNMPQFTKKTIKDLQ